MVELSNIGRLLGERPVLDICCKSSQINQWSFFKPVNVNTLAKIDRETLYQINDGFNISTYENPITMLSALKNDDNLWKYNKQTEPPYRLTDFEGYDHGAGPICILNFEGDNFGQVGDVLTLYCSDFSNLIKNWNYFDRNYGVDLIFLIDAGYQVYLYKIISFIDYIDGSYLTFRIPNVLTPGRYNLIFCCSNATEKLENEECRLIEGGMYEGIWYPFPKHTMTSVIVEN